MELRGDAEPGVAERQAGCLLELRQMQRDAQAAAGGMQVAAATPPNPPPMTATS